MEKIQVAMRIYNCFITLSNGNIVDYKPSNMGEHFDASVGESMTITLKPDKYMVSNPNPPLLAYYKQYTGDCLHKETFTQVDSKTYQLTTSFAIDYKDEYRAQIQAECNIGMAYVHTQIKNATINYQTGEYLPVSTSFIISCDSSYEFQVIPNITIETRYGTEYLDFDKVDETTYKLTLTLTKGVDFYIVGEAVKKSVALDKYGLITIYRPTKEELIKISKGRWLKVNREPVQVNGTTVLYNTIEEYIDTAKYVVSIMKLFVSLETDIRDKVYFGPYDMHLDCDVIGNDIITVSLGTVHIKGVYGNSIDYDNTELEAYLPFIGFVPLPTSDFMDKDVSLHYQVNVVNGDSLAVFNCNGHIMRSFSCNVSFHIPYQLGGNEYQNNDIQPNTNYLLNEPPFIYVKTHKANNPDTALPYHDTKFYSKFGDLTGYTEAKEVKFNVLSTHITKPEIDEIIQLLETGVFF